MENTIIQLSSELFTTHRKKHKLHKSAHSIILISITDMCIVLIVYSRQEHGNEPFDVM